MHIEKSSILPFSAENMYSIVTDIEAYPSFLEWCAGATVDDAITDSDVTVASLDIAFKRLSIAFTTRNVNRRNESIEMQLVRGPFSQLQGRWLFNELDQDACKVSLSMQFEFQNFLTGKLVGRVFEQLVGSQITAFEKRAQFLHG